MKKVFTTKEAARELKVSARTLGNWRNAGLISYSQIKHVILYTEDDINSFLQKYRQPVFSKRLKYKEV